MKKFTQLLLLTSALILSGCTKPEPSKINIYYKDETLTEVIEFSTLVDLESKILNKDNFILVSYADQTCACWGTFEQLVLNPFVNETKIPIYVIKTSLLGDDLKGLPINSAHSNTPVVGIFDEGVYKYGVAYNEDTSIFTQKAKFSAWLDTYIIRPIMTYISLDKLNTLLKGTTPFIINWSLEMCPDCTAINHRFMRDYFKKNEISQKLPYYLIETKDIRSHTELWTNIKKVYGLSDELNKASGYGTGFVPALQVIHPDGNDYVTSGDLSPIITDMFVFQNEFVEKVGEEYKISDSYFNGVRATKYLGNYESEIGKVVDPSLVYQRETGYRFVAGARYDQNAIFATKFFDYYWK